jgi:hypothetical protein
MSRGRSDSLLFLAKEYLAFVIERASLKYRVSITTSFSLFWKRTLSVFFEQVRIALPNDRWCRVMRGELVKKMEGIKRKIIRRKNLCGSGTLEAKVRDCRRRNLMKETSHWQSQP